ncbi:unnamed protein product [Clavelina lepadiformis]|uniref:Uncharacterized protein n=1 Tax=Clavelina lepadiformis TaxID=159417 RepID=A0ABP0G074_CLALP
MNKFILFCVLSAIFCVSASNAESSPLSHFIWKLLKAKGFWSAFVRSRLQVPGRGEEVNQIFAIIWTKAEQLLKPERASNAESYPLSQFIWKLLKAKGFWSAFVRPRLQVPARSEVVKKDNLLNANFLGK